MSRQIAIFGGSFNPPGVHHRTIAEHLAGVFDNVYIVPCGPRPDKQITNDVEPIYRAAMVDMTFKGLPRVHVELFDLERSTFTRNHELEAIYSPRGSVWHVVGTDLLQGGGKGESLIHRVWARGEWLWNECQFAVIKRPGFQIDPGDLPPRHRIFEIDLQGSSSRIRETVFQRQPHDGLVTPAVASYIDRHGLYRGITPPLVTHLKVSGERYFLIVDENNARAVEIARNLEGVPAVEAELIVVVGGDGTLLRAIRDHWRSRLPFYGINAGHIGFLLNQRSIAEQRGRELVLHQLPLLWVEMEAADGSMREALAFNDAWVERASGQTAWLKLKVDGQERLPQLVADGALVSTAAGSSAYARAMGATPLPLNTPAMLLVGSNVLKPHSWDPVVLPITSMVELVALDRRKRPLIGFIDGARQGEVYSMRARASNTATVELAFDPAMNPAEKLARIQFPLR